MKSFWDNPNNTMIEIFGLDIDEVKYVKLTDMGHHKQWTWYIDNQGKKTVSIKNFTVIYEGVIKPKESLGKFFMGLGFILIFIVIISLIVILKKYFTKSQI